MSNAKALHFKIYRYHPEKDEKPYVQDFHLDLDSSDSRPKKSSMMLLDALIMLKEQDDSLGFRRSCAQGVCGSDGMNINGKNGLACVTPMSELPCHKPIMIRPLPGFPVIRDLIVDMTQFYRQYESIKPYLINDTAPPGKERKQSIEDRNKLDGLYECILCACCSSSCPSYWWNPDKFLGPAALLQSARFIEDSRDTNTPERLEQLSDAYKLYRCRSIMNCVSVCPKGLNPTKAIGKIRKKMLQDGV